MWTVKTVQGVEHVACMREMRNAYEVLVGTSERKRSLRIPLHKWEDNIIMYLEEIRWVVVAWIRLAQDRDRWRALVNTVMNLAVPQKAGNFLTS